MSADPAATRAAIDALLRASNTMTLATSGSDGPWAAAVFFASDEALGLYFVSDPRTRHGRHITASGRAAAAVHADCADWAEIRGIQLEGAVTGLDGEARRAGLERYLAKFPRIRALCERPGDENEVRIAARLRDATLYRLAPERIRLIDNGRGFGFKAE
ncbi:MAG: pyridoxamine 5'-phosphate oxidase family protein, partial [Chromatiales bacterium]